MRKLAVAGNGKKIITLLLVTALCISYILCPMVVAAAETVREAGKVPAGELTEKKLAKKSWETLVSEAEKFNFGICAYDWNIDDYIYGWNMDDYCYSLVVDLINPRNIKTYNKTKYRDWQSAIEIFPWDNISAQELKKMYKVIISKHNEANKDMKVKLTIRSTADVWDYDFASLNSLKFVRDLGAPAMLKAGVKVYPKPNGSGKATTIKKDTKIVATEVKYMNEKGKATSTIKKKFNDVVKKPFNFVVSGRFDLGVCDFKTGKFLGYVSAEKAELIIK